MKNKRQLLFRAGALLIVLVIAVAMFIIGRGHTVYFDNTTKEYNGQTAEAFYRVTVSVDGQKPSKLSARDRGMAELMGQTLTMTLEITDAKDAQPHAHKVSMGVPYNMDGILINIPALMAGMPEEAYMSEFVIAPPQDDSSDEVPPDEANPDGLDTEEFEMGDI